MIHTIMMILTIIIILRIIEANLEDVDPTEVKIQVVSSEAKISVAEVNKIRTHTKANIKMTAIKAIITRTINHNPCRNFQQGNNYGQTRGRSHG